MRCREALIAMVKTAGTVEMVPTGQESPKRSDVGGWCGLIADHVAMGSSSQSVRQYLKATSKSTWQLVNWLTHASNATLADAVLAVDGTQHVIAVFGTAIFRHMRGIPDRCPACGSYKIGLRPHPSTEESVAGCTKCGWLSEDQAQ